MHRPPGLVIPGATIVSMIWVASVRDTMRRSISRNRITRIWVDKLMPRRRIWISSAENFATTNHIVAICHEMLRNRHGVRKYKPKWLKVIINSGGRWVYPSKNAGTRGIADGKRTVGIGKKYTSFQRAYPDLVFSRPGGHQDGLTSHLDHRWQ